MPLDHADFSRHIDGDVAEILRLLDGGRRDVLSAAVPACPGWTVRDLVGHLGGVHRWATGIVRTGAPGDPPDPPADDASLMPWFTDGASALVAALRESDPDASCWTLAPPRTGGFWSRRQAHETQVHRVDLADSVGAPAPLDPVLGADGVDEAVHTMFPRQVRLGRTAPLADTLALADRATGARWLLAGDGTGDVASEPQATVSGEPGDLLLLLWKRRSLDEVDVAVTGDREAAGRVLAARLTP